MIAQEIADQAGLGSGVLNGIDSDKPTDRPT